MKEVSDHGPFHNEDLHDAYQPRRRRRPEPQAHIYYLALEDRQHHMEIMAKRKHGACMNWRSTRAREVDFIVMCCCVSSAYVPN